MAGWVGAEMEVVDGMHAGLSQGSWSNIGRCYTDEARSHHRPDAQFRVGLSWKLSVFLERKKHGMPR